jgi:hypothetical protein
MLKALFGNRNVERILLFLFVNESAYAAQLQMALRSPLTPIQNALQRLLKGGIIESCSEGKIRMVRINPAHPLRTELDAILKKTYTLLSPEEKRKYCLLHKPKLSAAEEGKRERDCKQQLLHFWEQLGKVDQLICSTQSKAQEFPLHKWGKAEVSITAQSPTILIFQERGFWHIDHQPHTSFHNTYRWTLDLKASLIGLEHLRYGINQPVFLSHFAMARPFVFETVDPHLCAQDTYLGRIAWDQVSIQLYWRIIGPNKNEELDYRYTKS